MGDVFHHCFGLRARVGDDILYLADLLIVLPKLVTFHWIISLRRSLIVSMSSGSPLG